MFLSKVSETLWSSNEFGSSERLDCNDRYAETLETVTNLGRVGVARSGRETLVRARLLDEAGAEKE